MTMFEEEVTRPDNGPITELNNSMHSVLSQYRKMREYADYLEYELKQKDEHILKLENENSFMRDERTTFDSNGMAVEPKLQQQALPVVPEFVAEFIESYKDRRTIYGAFDKISKNRKTYPKLYEWVFEDENSQATFALAFITGKYEVEKPQLFYLKHIDFCKTDKHYDWFTIKHSDGPLNHLRVEKGEKPSTIDCKFTQQEINAMQTGSYEQIKVEVEK
ncbi:DUF1642 domain-containing protein [Lactococcus cremoris]|uniref:DUF1642 domain-containing protein n=1 Tax=Lactococcus lactis subsp. cremoris TaxID=1359 RepID=UPI0021CE8B3C|nr:DUF1642 domain-containing protein [Lactococcus cremoris]WJQ76190.1 DUF1642 domain-containing protein [Lactococcus cremoris]